MPATYTRITLDDMRATLKAERGWKEDTDFEYGTPREYVFTRDLTTLPGFRIKVYTSISKSNAHSRDKGRDAIRVVAIRKVGNEWRGLAKASRVHRTQNWRDNLMARIEQVFSLCKERVRP